MIEHRQRAGRLLLEAVGNIEEVKMALALSDSPRAHAFLAALAGPRGNTCTFATLARKCGMRSAALVKIWREYKLLQGTLAFLNGLPRVAEDMVEDARSTRISCPVCGGIGHIGPEGERNSLMCPQCIGTGTVRKFGNPDARKLIFEAVGITAKRGARLQQHVVQTDDGPSMIERVERAEGSLSIEAEFHQT